MSAQPEMSKLQPPQCQYCGQMLPSIGIYAYEIPSIGMGISGFAILNLYCPHCGRALHWQIFQKPPASALPGEEPPKSPLWKPS